MRKQKGNATVDNNILITLRRADNVPYSFLMWNKEKESATLGEDADSVGAFRLFFCKILPREP